MAKVTLDMETFKALASETRLQVLRALDARRKTLSELSREVELNKATVHEHLQLLVATGLVKKRDDEGRKWIYYELTWRGERLLHPQETTTFAVLLAITVVAAGAGLVLFGSAFDLWLDQPDIAIDEGEGDGAFEGAPAAAADPQNDTASEPEGPPSSLAQGQETRQTESAAGADDPFWDDDGLLAVLLTATAVLSAGLAFAIRRLRPLSA